MAKARQHLSGFLLRHAKVYAGQKTWTQAYRRWLTTVRFDHPAQQIVLQDYIHAVEDAEKRVTCLVQQIGHLLETWSMAPVVKAIQAMRGIALINAVTLVAEIGDFTRFASPRQLMAYLGLVPSEHSSGASVRRGGVTKAGNGQARRALIEGAKPHFRRRTYNSFTYRRPWLEAGSRQGKSSRPVMSRPLADARL